MVIMRNLAVLSLVGLVWALSGCGWQALLPEREPLHPQGRQTVIIEYFPFNMSDFPGLHERLIQAIEEDFMATYGRRPLEVRIGVPKALPGNLLSVVSHSPQRDRTAQVFEEYIDRIAAKIKSTPPMARVVTTPTPIEFCRAYRDADELLERAEFRHGMIFRVRGLRNWPSLLQSCPNFSLTR